MLKTLISLFIIALFVYMRLSPYKDKLNQRPLKVYNSLDSCIRPISSIIGKMCKPRQIGVGLYIDISSIILLLILLLILNLT